jgi:hypothetical protein
MMAAAPILLVASMLSQGVAFERLEPGASVRLLVVDPSIAETPLFRHLADYRAFLEDTGGAGLTHPRAIQALQPYLNDDKAFIVRTGTDAEFCRYYEGGPPNFQLMYINRTQQYGWVVDKRVRIQVK